MVRKHHRPTKRPLLLRVASKNPFPRAFVSLFSGLSDAKLPQPASSSENCLGLQPGYMPLSVFA